MAYPENAPVQEFEVQPIEIYFNGTERRKMRIHAETLINEYSATAWLDEVLLPLTSGKSDIDEVTGSTMQMYEASEAAKNVGVEGFRPYLQYAVRLPLIAYREVLLGSISVNDARYTPGNTESDCPDLEFGPVHLETGRMAVVFSGITFTAGANGFALPAADTTHDEGSFKAFGFIYDPSSRDFDYRALVAPIPTPSKDNQNEVHLKLIGALCNQLADDQPLA